MDLGNVAVAKVTGDVVCIALVISNFINGFVLSFGRRHEDTIQTLLDHKADDHDVGGFCLVADVESLKLDFKFFRQLLEGTCDISDNARALPVVSRVLAVSCEGVGNGNCFLVDV